MKKIIGPFAFFCLTLFASNSFASAENFKLKIQNTTAEKLKAKWYCADDMSLIDSDTYPSSTTTKRETTVGDSRCPSGNIQIHIYIKDISRGWKRVKKGMGLCTTHASTCGIYKKDEAFSLPFSEPYDAIKEGWFSSRNKLCGIMINRAFETIYLQHVNCSEI